MLKPIVGGMAGGMMPMLLLGLAGKFLDGPSTVQAVAIGGAIGLGATLSGSLLVFALRRLTKIAPVDDGIAQSLFAGTTGGAALPPVLSAYGGGSFEWSLVSTTVLAGAIGLLTGLLVGLLMAPFGARPQDRKK